MKKTGLASVDKPWQQYYGEELVKADIPEKTIYDYMADNNRDYPKDIAIEYFSRKITFGKMLAEIEKTAQAFLTLGVQKGDIVTVALPSIPEALYCLYGLNRIGAVVNLIHPLAGEEETLRYLQEVNSKVAVLFTKTFQDIKNSIQKTNLKFIITVSAMQSVFPVHLVGKTGGRSGILGWDAFIRQRKQTGISACKNPKEVAVISHTGGTTGIPKGVMLSDNNINACIWQIGCNIPHERQEVYMSVLPPFINYSLVNSMLEPLAFGFKVVLIPDYKPLKFGKYVKKYQPNYISSIPAYWEACLKIYFGKNALACLKHVYYGGDALPEKVEEQVNAVLRIKGAKHKLKKGLGATELTSAATVTYDECNIPGSVGIPLVKMNCKIVHLENSRECGYGEKGEICFNGPTVMLGYYKNEEATADMIHVHADGNRWLHSGDVGYMDENGILYVTGRVKRIIMTKGADGNITKLFPSRIESVIASAEAVREVCVVGVADKKRISIPKAYVILAEGYQPEEAARKEILQVCKKGLPDYMIPEEIVFRGEFPRTERGKIDYRELERLAEG